MCAALSSRCLFLRAKYSFVLADTSQLHNKISEMGQRIRQLEDALAIFQAGVSNETHPLLREELLAIKFGPDNANTPPKEKRPLEHSLDSMDALGTLTIGDRGEGKYFGRSAGSEVSSSSPLPRRMSKLIYCHMCVRHFSWWVPSQCVTGHSA